MTPDGNGHASAHAPNADVYLVHELDRRAYALRETFTIGRDTDSDLVVVEPTVSRTHARVTAQECGFMLESIGPTGTKVNGYRLQQPHQLAYGDRIEIGTTVLTVRTAPLPLGVSTADRPNPRIIDEIAARRPTIRHPLMTERVVEERVPWGKWIAIGVAGVALLTLFFRG